MTLRRDFKPEDPKPCIRCTQHGPDCENSCRDLDNWQAAQDLKRMEGKHVSKR